MNLKTFGNKAVIINFEDKSKEENFIIWKAELADFISCQYEDIYDDFILTSNEITIIFKDKIEYSFIKNLKELVAKHETKKQKYIRNLWEIPVCFDPVFSEDLLLYSKKNLISYDSFLEDFMKCTFQVNHFGFLPGFFYLSGLPKKLHIPRKSSPSKQVDKGTLAIGESNVGIYPQGSPGGWNKIGKTYVSFFNQSSDPPNQIIPGDKINFVSIDIYELKYKLENFSYSFDKFKSNSFEIIC